MIDIGKTIAPKSDQLNYDDFIAGESKTITITEVRSIGGDQPTAINYTGDNGKPWKPCKSMRRVLVAAWGPDGRAYIGRKVTLYGDPEVKFGGEKVGGIRISHLSHIQRPLTIPLAVTRAKRVPYTVLPLKSDTAPNLADYKAQGEEAAKKGMADLEKWWLSLTPQIKRQIGGAEYLEELKNIAGNAAAQDAPDTVFTEDADGDNNEVPEI